MLEYSEPTKQEYSLCYFSIKSDFCISEKISTNKL